MPAGPPEGLERRTVVGIIIPTVVIAEQPDLGTALLVAAAALTCTEGLWCRRLTSAYTAVRGEVIA